MYYLILGLPIFLEAHTLVGKLEKNPCRVEIGFTISTHLRKNICIDYVYKRVKVDIIGCEIRVDLLPLRLYEFDVILGMDFLSSYRHRWIVLQKLQESDI
jgi:hypothetical protein